jgi:hypothetical protein
MRAPDVTDPQTDNLVKYRAIAHVMPERRRESISLSG